MTSLSERAAAIVLAAAMLVVLILLSSYARHYFFLFDDFALVELARTQTAGQILSQPLIGYYRPLPFLLLRVEWFIFGWDHPAGYLAINLLFHVVNAGLCAWLTWLLRSPTLRTTSSGASSTGFALSAAGAARPDVPAGVGAGIAFVVVLASPWATEGYLWASSVFDLLATLGVLAAVVGVRLTVVSSRRAIAGIMLAGAGTALAAFSKENAVVIPALAVIAVLVDRPVKALLGRMTVVALIACAVPVLVYLAVRASLIGMLSGGYGDFSSLWRQGTLFLNICSYVRALVWFPMPPGSGRLLRLATTVLLLPLIAVLLARTRPRLLVAMIIAFVIATAPVCWYGLDADSTVAGRYAYLPELMLAIAIAAGLARTLTLPLPSLTPVTPLALMLTGVVFSAWYQVDIWGSACRLSRSVLAQLEPYRGRQDVALELENMPFMYVEGPFVLKAYAFRFYRDDHQPSLPPVRAHAWTVNYLQNSRVVDVAGIDPTSDYLDQPPTGLTVQSLHLRLTP